MTAAERDSVDIRPARGEDAPALGEFFGRVDTESPFLLAEPGERDLGRDALASRVQTVWAQPNSCMLLAVSGDEVVGFVQLIGGRARRRAHTALLVIAVVARRHGQGIGSALLREAEAWAREHAITRLELTVMVPNRRAIALYHKAGFVVEGTSRRSIRYADGSFVDEYAMAKLL